MEAASQKKNTSVSNNSSSVIYLHSSQVKPVEQNISFHRRELDLLLQVYSRKVGAGEWRDYAIDMLKDKAVFSVYRRSSEVPLYSIEKMPKLARKQGAWSVTNANGQILKRGHELRNVLKIFDKKPKLASV